MIKWHVIPSATDPDMFAVKSHYECGELYPEYIVADNLPIEDARLIAASPEMFDIVRRLAEYHESGGSPHLIAIEASNLWAKMQREAKGDE